MKGLCSILIIVAFFILSASCKSQHQLSSTHNTKSPFPVTINSERNYPYIHTDTTEEHIISDTTETYTLTECDTLPYIDYTKKLKRGSMKIDTIRHIDIIVIHSSHALGTDTFNVDGVIDLYNRYSVGAHYLIARNGDIYKLADENDIAFHAGESTLPADPSRHSLNKTSIGIEIINSNSAPPTEAQYESLAMLTEDIQSRRPIKYIYGHSDIAPSRKTDPWAFDWNRFFDLISFSNPKATDPTDEITTTTENSKKIETSNSNANAEN